MSHTASEGTLYVALDPLDSPPFWFVSITADEPAPGGRVLRSRVASDQQNAIDLAHRMSSDLIARGKAKRVMVTMAGAPAAEYLPATGSAANPVARTVIEDDPAWGYEPPSQPPPGYPSSSRGPSSYPPSSQPPSSEGGFFDPTRPFESWQARAILRAASRFGRNAQLVPSADPWHWFLFAPDQTGRQIPYEARVSRGGDVTISAANPAARRKLRSEIDTTEIEDEIRTDAAHHFGVDEGSIGTVFEHGHWWVVLDDAEYGDEELTFDVVDMAGGAYGYDQV